MTANNQRTTPGISSALDVPVRSDGEYVKRAIILMVCGERPVSLSRVLRRFAAASNGSLWWLAPVLKDGKKISGGIDGSVRENPGPCLIWGCGTYIA